MVGGSFPSLGHEGATCIASVDQGPHPVAELGSGGIAEHGPSQEHDPTQSVQVGPPQQSQLLNAYLSSKEFCKHVGKLTSSFS